MSEIFSDSALGKFPKSQAELSARLKSIESCINNKENLQNVNFLSSAEACKNYDQQLKFPYNSSEGVLRKGNVTLHPVDASKRLEIFGVIPA